MTLTSFAITLYGQCCRRHVVGQHAVSDISAVRSWSICSLCSETNNANLLLRLLIAVLWTSILLQIPNIVWPTTWRRTCTWWPSDATARYLFSTYCRRSETRPVTKSTSSCHWLQNVHYKTSVREMIPRISWVHLLTVTMTSENTAAQRRASHVHHSGDMDDTFNTRLWTGCHQTKRKPGRPQNDWTTLLKTI